MPLSNNTPTSRLVQLTPPGRGAVATLLVEGSAALQAAEELLCLKGGKKLTDFPVDWPILAHFGSPNGEEVIARCHNSHTGWHGHLANAELEENRISPQTSQHWQDASGTQHKHGQDASGTPEQSGTIELHCHGGIASIQAIEEAFVERGFLLLAWNEWVAENVEDTIAADARIALADARTERTAAILLDQYQGALRRELENPDLNLAQIEAILQRDSLGQHLTKPWKVVLMGEPNVGKSSLLNALLGYRRAIVHHTPGTTRDVVSVQTAFEGWPVELCDTAGLRNVHLGEQGSEHDAIERAGIERARRYIAKADLLLLVFDASKPWTTADEALRKQYPQAIILYNKADLAQSVENRPAGMFLSALTGQGIEQLPCLLAGRLVPNPPPPGAAVPFTEEQMEMVRSHEQRLSQ